MNINIKATNMEMTEAIRQYVFKKLEGLEKLTGANDDSLVASMEVGKISNHHKSGEIFRAAVNVIYKGDQFMAQSEKEDLYAAIDDVKDEIIQEIKKHKDRKRSLIRRGGQKIKGLLKGVWNKD